MDVSAGGDARVIFGGGGRALELCESFGRSALGQDPSAGAAPPINASSLESTNVWTYDFLRVLD